MSRKAFEVQIELNIQAVTCPGVWLCSNGKVSLQIYMLDSCVQTGSFKPHFPVEFGENYTFTKIFLSKHRLSDLQKDLRSEWIYVEMIQWQSCETGNVLATFQTTLDELLFPSTNRGSIAGVDVDLLMEPAKSFPGSIAPKIELSTKTTIEEILFDQETLKCSSTVVVNPKLLISTNNKSKNKRNICRRVCHSVAFSKRKRLPFNPAKLKPPFVYRRAEDDLILRKPQGHLSPQKCCSCRSSRSLERIFRQGKGQKLRKPHQCRIEMRMCSCGHIHRENSCPVCAKYCGYFKSSSLPPSPKNSPLPNIRSNTLFENRNSNYPSYTKVTSCNSRGDLGSSQDLSKRTCLICKNDEKLSLAGKLHQKLTKTLEKSGDWICGAEDDRTTECSCPACQPASPPPPQRHHKSRADFYRDLQKFYGKLYEKARTHASSSSASCIPSCPKYD